MSFTIRKAIKSDASDILGLIQHLADFENEPDAVVVTLKDIENDGFGENPLFEVLVAEKDDKIVGMALFYYRYSTWKGKTIHLEDLIVLENMRKQNIGSALYDAVLKQAYQEKVRRVEWVVLDWNTPARDFYLSSGAKILDGYGNMGKSFAKKLRGFDVEVICYDIKDNVGDENCRQVSLAELQEKSDVLSIHTPFNKLSHNMINTELINGFSKPFWLLNTARGTAVVTSDLSEALKNGKILGAGLDVLEYEKLSFENLFKNDVTSSVVEMPKAFEYLINADNVLLSPHVAGWTVESKIKLAQTIVDKISNEF